jgi:hypothetical protein
LPPFVSASSSVVDPLRKAVCKTRRALQDSGSSSAIVVGRHDVKELSVQSKAEFGSNLGLGQQRGNIVRLLLRDERLCGSDSVPVQNVLVLLDGPINTRLASFKTSAERDAALADDRRVEVYGFRVIASAPKGTQPQ